MVTANDGFCCSFAESVSDHFCSIPTVFKLFRGPLSNKQVSRWGHYIMYLTLRGPTGPIDHHQVHFKTFKMFHNKRLVKRITLNETKRDAINYWSCVPNAELMTLCFLSTITSKIVSFSTWKQVTDVCN